MQNQETLLNVTGQTKLYVVIGDPIQQVRSTALYNKLVAEKGIDAVFVPLQFSAENFSAAVAGLRTFKNVAGIIPTIPHKTKMLNSADEVSPRARLVGGVNAIRCESDGRWVGDIFDGVGYVNGLLANGRDPRGKSFLLVGVGGAGAAMAFALAEAGVTRLRLFDLAEDKAELVAQKVTAKYPEVQVDVGPAEPAGFDVVANATPLGMQEGDLLPVDPGKLVSSQLVTDMIMKPSVTPLLKAAEAKGCETHVGYEALLGQAKANMEFFGLL